MLSIEFVITKDQASPALKSVAYGLQPENLMPVLARSVSNSVRDHFDDLEGTRPNKMGGERTHYYSGARAGTSYTVEGDTATVHVSQVGIRLRYYGGTVEAGKGVSSATGQPTKYLTIPATPETYGHRAADFPDMKVLWGKNGPYGLGRVEQKMMATVKSSGPSTKETTIMFWLKASVDIQGDRTMLPSDSELNDALQENFGKYVAMLWRRRAA